MIFSLQKLQQYQLQAPLEESREDLRGNATNILPS
jgi:hypothetical protein